MTDAWAESAEGWDDNPAVRQYAAAAHHSLLATLEQEFFPLEGRDVLDFGCGTGLMTARLADQAKSIIGLDTSPAMLEQFEARASAWPHVRAEAGPLPADVRVDLVVASSVLGFVPDLGATLRMLSGHLRPGGLLVHWDWERQPGGEDGVSRDEVRAAMMSAGLRLCSLDIAFELQFDGYTMAPLRGVARKGKSSKGC
ncbi:MAG: class I SAM-dependent methyltransferase [Myxococcota bacterium]